MIFDKVTNSLKIKEIESAINSQYAYESTDTKLQMIQIMLLDEILSTLCPEVNAVGSISVEDIENNKKSLQLEPNAIF